uniref:Neur_chan_LBD domain-containing protein n=1 Tax=Steinernema glaseri TaxID=37863 RepID=A0A1I7ZYV6_9BILA
MSLDQVFGNYKITMIIPFSLFFPLFLRYYRPEAHSEAPYGYVYGSRGLPFTKHNITLSFTISTNPLNMTTKRSFDAGFWVISRPIIKMPAFT